MTATVTSEYQLVDPKQVHPHPRNVRRTVTGVDELAASIKAGGLHQPLVVASADTADDEAGFTLVMGHRRHAAVTQLGWAEVPCIIRHDLNTEAKIIEAMLAENIARADLTVTEEGDAVQALLDLDVKPAKIGKAIGRTAKHVSGRAQIAALTTKAREAVDDGQITITDALHLSKLDGDHEMALRVESSIGTPNFRYTLEKALQETEFNRKRAEAIAELEAAGATITDGPAVPDDGQVRIFLTTRPDDVTDPQVSVSVSEWTGWGQMRTQWVQIRPRDEEDPEGANTFLSHTDDDDEHDDGAAAQEQARRSALQAVREEQRAVENRARDERETAQATRHRWLHEVWKQGMVADTKSTRERLLHNLIQAPGVGYFNAPNVTRMAPIVVGPGTKLEADDPALDPGGWALDKLVFASWWIHVGFERDKVAARPSHLWDDDTVSYLENLVLDYDYPLSSVEEALLKEYADFHADDESDAD